MMMMHRRRQRRPPDGSVALPATAESCASQWPHRLRAAATTTALVAMAAAWSAACVPAVAAHGYLKTPRSRNLVAYQDKNSQTYLGGTGGSHDPQPEYCPHCLNRGGTLAQCGILLGTRNNVPWERNYDRPLNSRGEPMPPNIQGVYKEGSVIEVEVLVTTHHKGHFEFSVCPIEGGGRRLRRKKKKKNKKEKIAQEENMAGDSMLEPTQECFARNKLQFVSDDLYGAPPDPNHPERAYITPATNANWVQGHPDDQPVVGAHYKMQFRLPPGVVGDVVLLQWYYLTANSCKHEGYADFPFPREWGSDVSLYPGLPDCGALPPDGNGVPEQFWNCAEIKVIGDGSSAIATAQNARADPDTPPPTPFTSEDPTQSPTFVPTVTLDPTPAPTLVPKLCADDSSSYYEATQDCAGYIYCTMGVADKVYYCGDDMLYDQRAQRCNWAEQVAECGGGAGQDATGASATGTSAAPAPPPTRKPNALLDWDRHSANRGHDKTIIGYYASWQWYDRDGLAAPANMDFSKITRANFAFFQITPQGDIFGTDSWADPITLFGFYDWMSAPGQDVYCSWDEPGVPPKCSAHNYEEGLIYLAHAAGAEVYPSIGGWSLSEPFPVMAASGAARRHFANQCVELIKSYGFDGIDLDWEYPGYEPHAGTPEDTVNFNLLLNDVRAALDGLGEETGHFYGLTAALPCGPSIIDNMDIFHVSQLLTELNLMTYDFHGSWNDKTGVNAPVYDQEGSPEFSVHGCVKNWLEGGAKKEKVNIGFPFYGRSFLKAQHLYESHQGGDMSIWWVDEGVPQYYNILKEMNQFTSVRDEQTMTQYMYGSTGMVSYDDEQAICDKTEYAQVHQLNGYIIWELSGDMNEDGSTPLLDAANAKLLNPDMDCADITWSEKSGKLTSEILSDDSGPEVVFYPDFSGSKCLSDGLHGDWFESAKLSDSAQGCCGKHFSWNKVCVQNSEATIPLEANSPASVTALYYPSTSASVCLSDGKQSEWLSKGSIHDTAEGCCGKHFGWNEACIQNSEEAIPLESNSSVSVSALYYPSTSASVCLSDGKQSELLSKGSIHDTAEACCEAHYSVSRDCVRNSGGSATVLATEAAPVTFTSPIKDTSIAKVTTTTTTQVTTTAATTTATATATAATVPPPRQNRNSEFFPVFNNGTTTCENVGTPPSWLTSDALKQTKSECCQNYAFAWDYDKCLTGLAADSPASFASIDRRDKYYLDFEAKTCIDVGNRPDWMAGEYLAETLTQCCNNISKDEELARQCRSSDWNESKAPAMNNYSKGKETPPSNNDKAKHKDKQKINSNKNKGKGKNEDKEVVQGKPLGDKPPPGSSPAQVLGLLSSKSEIIDSELFLYETTNGWLPSTIYSHDGLSKGLKIMNSPGVAGMHYYLGNKDEGKRGYQYGLTNVAAFLAQSMKETIKYNACSENNWDLVNEEYPASNACGQLGQSYQDYKCPKGEEHMACEIDLNMEIKATTNAKWYGAPAPLFCQPKKSKTGFAGKWNYMKECNQPWSEPPMKCTDYDGQKAGGYDDDSPVANLAGRTDVEGCCWWGRGVIQTTGPCNFGKLNYYLGARAAREGGDAPYPSIDFCKDPEIICSSTRFKELKWVAGMFYWMETVQQYDVGGWSYMDELRKFVDGNFQNRNFIDSVSGIVNRGCHNPPCGTGPVDGGYERYNNFRKTLKAFELLG